MCERCERLAIELKINADTIARVTQDNKILRAYIEKLEKDIIRGDPEWRG